MIPVALQKQIYQSIPQSATIGPTGPTCAAKIAWADTIDISSALKTSPIAVSVRISGDTPDNDWTTPGMLANIQQNTDTQTRTRRQYRRATLTLSVHAAGYRYTTQDQQIRVFDTEVMHDTGAKTTIQNPEEWVAAAVVIEAYVTNVLAWAMSTLRDIINVANDPDVTELNYLEDGGERRDITLYVRYPQDVTEINDTISDWDVEVTVT